MISRTDDNQVLTLKLMIAIRDGKFDDIRNLIAAGADLAAVDEKNLTPIEYAADRGLWSAVATIASSKKTNANDTYHYRRVLEMAASVDKFDIMRTLLAAGASPLGKFLNYASTLHWAIDHAVGMIEALLAHGADLSATDDANRTPIVRAGFNSKWMSIEKIIALKPADTEDKYGYSSALLYTVSSKKYFLCEELLKKGAKTNGFYSGTLNTLNTPLHVAVGCCDIRLVRLLLKYQANLAAQNNEKKTPIEIAADHYWWQGVKIIAKSAKTDEADSFHYRHALLAAAKANKMKTVQVLLDAGAPAYGSIGTETLLHRAIRENDEKMIARLIKCGADLAELNKDGQTAMDYAVALQKWNCVSIIAQNIKNTADDTYHYGNALSVAVRHQQKLAADALLDGGAMNHHEMNTKLKNILHDALSYGSSNLLSHLIRHDADLSAVVNDLTPIQRLVVYDDWENIKLLAQTKDADKNDTYRYGSALASAVRSDAYDAAEALLQAHASKTWLCYGGCAMLHRAVEDKNLRMLKLLLKHDVNRAKIYNDQTPIEMAASQGLWEYVDAFLEYKTDDKDSYHYTKAALTYLHVSSIDRKVMKKFIQAGVCNNKSNASLLFVNTVNRGEVEICGDLLDAGADVNSQLKRYGSPLHLAVQSHHSDMLKYLLERGAAQIAVDEQNRTPVELAAALGYWDCVELLVQFNHRGGNDKKQVEDAHYEQALLFAIKEGHYSAVKLLLEKGAPFDRCSLELGNIALYWAVKNNAKKPEIITLLLEHGIDASVRNKDGKTVAELAKEWGHTDCYLRLNDYRSIIKQGKSADEYRRDANEIYRELQLNAHQPNQIPVKIKQLHACYQALLNCDLIALEQRRDELKNKENNKSDVSALLIDIPVDVDAEMESINATMMAINTLLKFPDKSLSPTLIHKTTASEGKDVKDFLQRKSSTDEYLLRVRKYLRDLKAEMDRAEFKVKGPFGLWVAGTPRHLRQVRAILSKLDSSYAPDDTYAVFVEIMNIFMSIENSAKRHENTKIFYDHFTRDIKALSFTPVSNSMQSEASSLFARQPLPAASVLQSQRAVESKDFSAGYEPIYPVITDTVISFPVVRDQHNELLPLLASIPDTKENMQELLSTRDLIDFSQAEDDLFQLPDLPKRETVKPQSIFQQPSAIREDTTNAVKNKKIALLN